MSRSARDYREFLRAGRWFRGLPDAFQERLLAVARLRELAADTRLFARGDPPCGLYAVIDGAIRISGASDAGREALLTLAEPPAWFGEIAVFDGLARTHDAEAQGGAVVVHVPQAPLLAILDGEPRWWRDLGLLVAGKLRLAFVVMEEVALLPPAVRLARRLVMMADGFGGWHGRTRRVVEVKQEQLAAMVNVSRQTCNQILKELEGQGLIKLAYGEIEILDMEGLRTAGGERLP